MPPKCSVEVLSAVSKHKVSYQVCVCVSVCMKSVYVFKQKYT